MALSGKALSAVIAVNRRQTFELEVDSWVPEGAATAVAGHLGHIIRDDFDLSRIRVHVN